MLPVLMAWHASNSFGWGIAGLNIFCHWAVSDTIEPYVLRPIVESDLTMVDPLRQLRIARSIVRSNGFSQRLAATSDKAISLNIPVVHAVGNRDIGARGRIQGKCNVGRTVIEDTRLDDWSASFAQFDVLVTASTWNMELLRANGAPEVVLIHEGIDPSLFHPGPRSGLLDPGRFYIFTGGKIEFRKAQDLVLLAFKRFSARHDDAVLVTSWHSPWPERERGFKGVLSSPVELGANGRLAIKKWAADNGVDPAKVIDIGAVPNQLMPQILREMDCALQPSRAEGGTNFFAMEAMACGLPAILAYNTGVRDLVEGENCLPLMQQRPVRHPDGRGVEGWGESDVDEIVAALETLHGSSARRAQIGAAASESMRARTWKRHADELARVVRSIESLDGCPPIRSTLAGGPQ